MENIKAIFDSFTSSNILKDNVLVNRQLRGATFAESRIIKSGDVDFYRPPKEQLRLLVGKYKKYPEDIGDHPDFAHLHGNQSEYHYITSVFVDMKGSTLLATKLPLESVRQIKNGLLVTAIDIFQAFDGHVHRLQGDAIFAFFGRKTMDKADAIIDALNATSILQYYVKSELSPRFEECGFPSVKIRVGIDFGDNDKVLWTKYGIKNCSEITTTSIHTDIAFKLQSKAAANSTMIGNNIVDFLDLPDEFYSISIRQSDKETIYDRYVINNDYLTYSMWSFDWKTYISRFSFIESESNFSYKSPRDFHIRCFYKYPEDNEFTKEYMSNCLALPKHVVLKFVLTVANHVRWDDIIWEVNNRGTEATQEGQINYEMTCCRKKLECLQATAYKGQHYMKCTLRYQGRTLGEDYFGIYVRQ